MSGYWKNRNRPRSIAFHVSDEERNTIKAKALLAGLTQREYCRRCTLDKEIVIRVGKYQSDRLSVELRRLRKTLQALSNEPELFTETLIECRAFLEQIIEISKGKGDAYDE